MDYKNILEILGQYWGLITIVGTGIGGYLTWLRKRQTSTLALYGKMDELKLKVIAQVTREIELVEQSAKLSEEVTEKGRVILRKDKIIQELKDRCPDCYNKFIDDQQ